MRIKKVNSDAIKLYQTSQIKFKTAGNTREDLFETFSPLTNRANLALPYEWNSMTGIQQFQVKSGTAIITGAAAPQSSFGAQYIGGAHQWYINDLEDLIKCQQKKNIKKIIWMFSNR